jgi:hypothetical protein
VSLDRNGDDEHDQQHEQHVDQRRRVDVHDRFALSIVARGLHGHGG